MDERQTVEALIERLVAESNLPNDRARDGLVETFYLSRTPP
jgi:hypothetical protein